MPSSISGIELGLLNTRINGAQGQAAQGQAGLGLAVNTTTGNLVLQQQDQLLVGQGIDTGLIRTYNSQGQYNDDNQDNFRFAFNQRLVGLSGTANMANSRITHIAGDGSESTFYFDEESGHYVSTEGAGAYDSLSYDEVRNEWLFTDGDTQSQQVYSWSNGEGRIISRSDTDGNQVTYRYGSNGFIDRVTDASGQVMSIEYSGNNVTAVATSSNGVDQRFVRYAYDTTNRLTQVSIDLSPTDNSVADDHQYLTQYTYDGDSHRIAQVSQSDGSVTAFTYDVTGRIATVTTGDSEVITYTYSLADDLDGASAQSTDHLLNTARLTSNETAQSAAYFTVSSGATWASVAQALYGSSDVATQLESTLTPLGYHLSLNERILSTDLPSQFTTVSANTGGVPVSLDTTQLATDTATVYSITAGDTWASIAQLLYGNGALASTLASHYDNRSLIAGDHLEAPPAALVGTIENESAPVTVTLNTAALSDGETMAESALLWSQDFSADASGLSALNSQYTVQNGRLNVAQGSGEHWISGDRLYDLSYPLSLSAEISVSAWNNNGDINFGIKNPDSSQAHIGYFAGGRAYAAWRQTSGGWGVVNLGAVSLNTTYTFEVDATASGSTLYIYEVGTSRESGYQNTHNESWTEAHTTISTYGGGITGWVDNVVEMRTDVPTNTATPTLYNVPTGGTPESVALALYGTTQVAGALLAELSALGYQLDEGERIAVSDLPISLSYTESQSTPIQGALDPSQLTTETSAYYPVASGDTWVSLAEILYDNAEAANQLESALTVLGYSLSMGEQILQRDLPSSLTIQMAPEPVTLEAALDRNPLTTSSSTYYTIASGDTWASIAQILYGNSDLGDALAEHYGSSTLVSGQTLSALPTSLNDTLVSASSPITATLDASALGDGETVAESALLWSQDFSADASGLSALNSQYTVQNGRLNVAQGSGEHWISGDRLYDLSYPLSLSAEISVSAWNNNGDINFGIKNPDSSQAHIGYFAGGRAYAAWRQTSGGWGVVNLGAVSLNTTYTFEVDATASGSTLYIYEVGTSRESGYQNTHNESWTEAHTTISTYGGGITGWVDNVVEMRTDVPTNTATPTLYNVPTGGTPESVALALYGTTQVAGALLAELSALGYQLDEGERIAVSDLPISLSYTESQSTPIQGALDPSQLTTDTSIYYTVLSSAETWASLANTLYGTDLVGSALEEQLVPLGYTLTVGEQIQDSHLPLALTVTVTTELNSVTYDLHLNALNTPTLPTVQTYYPVQSGDTWASIAQVLYGTTAVVDQLNSALGSSYTLTAGEQIDINDLPSLLQSQTTPVVTGVSQTTITDALGYETTYDFDDQGNVVQMQSPIIDGARITTQYTYDADNNLLEKSNGASVTRYEYDERGNRILEQDSEGNSALYLYSDTNRLLEETRFLGRDPDGAGSARASGAQITQYVYDDNQHLRFSVSAEGRVSEYRYTSDGNLSTSLSYTSSFYAGADISEAALTAWTSAQDLTQVQRIDTLYDFRGQAESITTYAQTDSSGEGIVDGSESTTQFIYDQNGRLLSTVAANGTATATANDYKTDYTYDGLGRLLTTRDALGRITAMTYNDSDQQIQTRAANGLISTALLDGNGRIISQTQADDTNSLGTVRYDYDAVGNRITTTDAIGNQTHTFYDGLNRAVASVDAEGALSTVSYDDNSNVVETISYATTLSDGQINSLITAGNNGTTVAVLTSIQDDLASQENRTSHNLYNTANQLIYTIDNARYVTQYFYDGKGQLTDTIVYDRPQNMADFLGVANISDITPLTQSDDRHSRMFYTADGRIQGTLDAEGYLTENTYDAAGQLSKTTAYAYQTPTTLHTSGDFAALRDSIVPNQWTDRHNHLFYNGKGQLVATLDAEGYLSETVYDANGNMIESIRYATQAISGNPVTYNGESLEELRPAPANNDRVTVTTYSQLDQVLSVSQRADNTVVTTTAYGYDEVGQLTTTITAIATDEVRTNRARYDVQGRLVGELSGEGSAALAALSNPSLAQIDALWADYGVTYTYDLAGRRASTTDANGNTTFFYYNDRNQLTHTVNALGEVSETTYNAFGEVETTRAYTNRISTMGLVGGERTAAFDNSIASARDDSTDNQSTYEYQFGGKVIYSRDAEDYWRQTNASNAFNEVDVQLVSSEKGKLSLAPSTVSGIQSASYYDRVGNITTSIEDTTGLQRQTLAQYNAFGQIASETDADSVRHFYTHDRLGRTIKTRAAANTANPIGNDISYDAFGRVLTQTDGNNNVTTYTYDDAARSITVTTPEGITTTTTTNEHGEVVRIVDGEENVTTYDYDLNGNLISTSQAVGTADEITTTSNFDHANLATETEDANGTVTRFDYDAANRLLTTTVDPSGLSIQNHYRYDGQGRTVYSVDANGILTETQYDRRGQVVATVVDPTSYPSDIVRPTEVGPALNLRTEYQYDGRGNTLTMIESAGTNEETSTSYQYDKLGRLITQTTDPDGLAIVAQFSYDANDNLIQSTNAAGTSDEQHSYFAYDAHQRTTHTIDSLGYVTATEYDDNGNALSTRRYATALSATELASLDGSDTAVESALAGKADSLMDRVTAFEYDDDNRLERTIIDPAGLAITSQQSYDDNGNIATQTNANGTITRFAYDALNRLTDTVVDETGVNLVSSQAYDSNGNVIRISEGANTANARITRFAYDTGNRLTHTIDAAGFVTAQTLDSNGNTLRTVAYATALSAADISAIDGGTASIENRLSSAADDRVMRYGYDSVNRQVYTVDAEGYATQYSYDDSGNLTRVLQYVHQLEESQLTALDNGAELTVERSPQDRVSYNRFDELNRQTYSVNALGFVSENTYNDVGQVIATHAYSQPITTTAQFQALAAGTLDIAAAVSQSDTVQIQRYVYDTNNRLRFTIDSLNYVTETRYDDLGQQAQTIRYSGTVSPSAFTESGLVNALLSQASNSDNQVMQYQFDAAGRTSVQIDPEGATERFSYDDRGNLTRTEDANGGLTYAYYDNADRLIYQVDAAGFVSEFSYNTFGETTDEIRYEQALSSSYSEATSLADIAAQLREPQFTVNADQKTTYTYTKQGLVDTTAYHYEGGTYTEINRYDAFGNRTQYTDRNQHTWDYDYNALGQMTATLSPEVEVATAVTATDHTMDNHRLRSEYDYDAFGNQTVNREAVGLPQQRETRTVYNTLGQVVRIESPAIEVYNPDTNTSQVQTPTLERVYDGFGNMVQEIDAAGVSSFHYYDHANRLVNMVDADRVLHEFAYDAAGNLILERTYDTRIIGAHLNGRPGAVANDTFRELRYTFDANNRTTSVSTPEVTHFDAARLENVGSNEERFPYFQESVVNSMEYDAKGNVIKTTDPRGNSTYQFYDSLDNQILSIDELGYVTSRVFGNNGQLLRETRHATALPETTFSSLTVDRDPVALLQTVPPSADDRISESHYDALGRVQAQYQVDVSYHTVNEANGTLQQENGNIWTRYTHDGNGNVIEIDKPLDGPITTTYDALGRQTAVSGSEFTAYISANIDQTTRAIVRFNYDALGNVVVQEQLGHRASDTRTSRAIFDNAGFKTADIDAEGSLITYGLNIFGQTVFQQQVVTDVNDQSAAYNTYYFYDDLGRELSTQQIKDLGLASEERYNSIENRYNAHGEIEAKGINGQFQEYYEYDSIGRLFKTNEGSGAPRFYLHDQNGNVTAEVVSINSDLSNIQAASDISILNPETIQMTVNFYDDRDQLTDVIDPPMEYTGLTTALDVEDETIITPNGDPVDTFIPLEQVGGLTTSDNLIGDVSVATENTFTPPVPSTTTEKLSALGRLGMSVGTTTTTAADGTVTRTMVEQLANGDVIERIYTTPAGSTETVVTRSHTVEDVTTVAVEPIALDAAGSSTLRFFGGVPIEVNSEILPENAFSTVLEPGGPDVIERTIYPTEYRVTITAPSALVMGDGNYRIQIPGLYDREVAPGETVVFTYPYYSKPWEPNGPFGEELPSGPRAPVSTIRISKGGEEIYNGSINNPLPDIISVQGQHASINSDGRVRLRVDGGAWIELRGESFQGSAHEFIAQGLDVSAVDSYEYQALNSDGDIVNWARGTLGAPSSHEHISKVTTESAVRHRIYELPGDRQAVEVAPQQSTVLSTTRSLYQRRNPITALNNSEYLRADLSSRIPNLDIGDTSSTGPEIVLPATTSTEGGVTTTTVVTEQTITTRKVELSPTDPNLIIETITTSLTRKINNTTETNQELASVVDDDRFISTTNVEAGSDVKTEIEEETVVKYHQLERTTIVDQLSSPPVPSEYNGEVVFESAGQISVESRRGPIISQGAEEGPTYGPSILTINVPDLAGEGGDILIRAISTRDNNPVLWEQRVSEGITEFSGYYALYPVWIYAYRDGEQIGVQQRTRNTNFSVPKSVAIQDINPLAQSARIRFAGGDWQAMSGEYVNGGKKGFVLYGAGNNLQAYEYELYDAAGNLLQRATGRVNSGPNTSTYNARERITETYTVTGSSDWSFYNSLAGSASSEQINYINRLVQTISYGETENNIIHRQQTHNAFGEVISETDGRDNTTELVYDKLGNVTTKISPETDVWTEEAVRANQVERARPTEHFYFNAQGELIGTQDANSDLRAAADKYYNTRVLENGQVKKEFFADGSTKDYRYDHFSNLRETTNQVGLDTRFEYDNNNLMVRTERYDNVSQLHSYDNFDYDQRGNRIAHENALGNTETYQYDGEGRVILHNSFEGRSTQYAYAYDSTITDGIVYANAANGRAIGGTVTTMTNANGDTLIDHNNYFGKLTHHEDLGGHKFDYIYNNAGWLTRQTGDTELIAANDEIVRANQDINYDYYANGYLKSVNDVGHNSHAFFQYDENGNRISEYYAETPIGEGEQARVAYQVSSATYDELNRVVRVDEGDRYDIRYEYDANGNRRRVHSQYFDLLRDQTTEQDFYYRYDEMNRFTVTLGTLDSNRNIVHGNTGYTIGYNALGQRVSAESELLNGNDEAIHIREIYNYDPNGALTDFRSYSIDDSNRATLQNRSTRQNNAAGQMEGYTQYAVNSGINSETRVLAETYRYDKDGLLTLKRNVTDANLHRVTTNHYLADGTLDKSVQHAEKNGRIDLDENSRITSQYVYDDWDSYKQKSVRVSGEQNNVRSWEVGTSTYAYNSNGHISSVYDHVEDRTIRYVNNHLGQVMKRYQIDVEEGGTSEALPVIRRFYYLNGIGIGDTGTDEVLSRVDYAQILAERNVTQGDSKSGHAHGDIKNRVQAVTSADFDQNYQPISPDYPDHTPGSYTINSGDTLQGIAAQVWGDASLWYLIADANGLDGNSQLTEGVRLSLPNTVTNIHNNSDTFRPYDAGLTLGDTSPTLPDPVFNSNKDSCGAFKQIIVIVVAIVVAYFTGGAAATALNGGVAVTGGTVTAASVGGAVIGAAAGSIASQVVAVGLGVQDGFDWGSVAIAAVSAGLTSGINIQGLGSATKFVNGAVKGIVSNTVGQQINISLGRQDSFDWQGTAIAGIAGGASAQLTSEVTPGKWSADKFGQNLSNGLIRGAVNNVTERLVRGNSAYQARGGFDVMGLVTNAVGNAIGDTVVGGLEYGADQNRQEQRRLDEIDRRLQNSVREAAENLLGPYSISGSSNNTGFDTEPSTYTVKAGDNAWNIAKANRQGGETTKQALTRIGQQNPELLANANQIKPGQTLIVSGGQNLVSRSDTLNALGAADNAYRADLAIQSRVADFNFGDVASSALGSIGSFVGSKLSAVGNYFGEKFSYLESAVNSFSAGYSSYEKGFADLDGYEMWGRIGRIGTDGYKVLKHATILLGGVAERSSWLDQEYHPFFSANLNPETSIIPSIDTIDTGNVFSNMIIGAGAEIYNIGGLVVNGFSNGISLPSQLYAHARSISLAEADQEILAHMASTGPAAPLLMSGAQLVSAPRQLTSFFRSNRIMGDVPNSNSTRNLAGLADNEAGGFASPIRRLTPTNDIDPGAQAFAKRFDGQPSVQIEGFGNREFDMVSDRFVGQAFGPKVQGQAPAFEANAKNFLSKSRRTQIRTTLEAAQVTQRQALFEFSGGKPSQEVLDFIQRNAQRQNATFRINLVD